jgi:hypothetical protein
MGDFFKPCPSRAKASFQALAALITERMNAVENKEQVFRLHSIKTISYAESSDREQFIISKTGITLKKQNYEALDNKTLYIKVDIVLTDGVPLRLYVIFTVLDVAEAPKNIQLSNSTIEAGSVINLNKIITSWFFINLCLNT